jgi:hypothetical protein
MKLFGRELQGFAKTLVVLSAIFLVASGMCGLQMFLANHAGAYSGTGAFIVPLGIAELAAMLLSAAAIVLVLIAWGGRALYDHFSSKPKG